MHPSQLVVARGMGNHERFGIQHPLRDGALAQPGVLRQGEPVMRGQGQHEAVGEEGAHGVAHYTASTRTAPGQT